MVRLGTQQHSRRLRWRTMRDRLNRTAPRLDDERFNPKAGFLSAFCRLDLGLRKRFFTSRAVPRAFTHYLHEGSLECLHEVWAFQTDASDPTTLAIHFTS